MTRWLLALLLLAAGMPAGAGQPPQPVLDPRPALDPGPALDPEQALDACIDKLDRSLDIGYARISARCPELAVTLLASPWAPWLPADWNKPDNQLSAQGLSELRDLLGREAAPAAAGRALHASRQRLGEVLAGIRKAPPAPEGWWARFKHWLRDVLTPRSREQDDWWHRVFGDLQVGQAAKRAIVFVALGLLVALAVAVVLNELRVGGFVRARRHRSRGTAPASRRGSMSLGEIESASPAAQPALLLEFIATRLAEQDRLPPARAFTAKELIRRARVVDESDRLRLAELAMVCERVRFSGREVPPQVLGGAMAQGRQFLAGLESRAVPASGVW